MRPQWKRGDPERRRREPKKSFFFLSIALRSITAGRKRSATTKAGVIPRVFREASAGTFSKQFASLCFYHSAAAPVCGTFYAHSTLWDAQSQKESRRKRRRQEESGR